jgi:hypothetical protein
VIERIAFVPSAPFLLFGQGPEDLAVAIATAVATLDGHVTVLGDAPPGIQQGGVDRTRFGARGTATSNPLPLALAVGTTLLGERSHTLVGPGTVLAGSVLVVADGTAKRTEKAPGHFDSRAQALDEAVDAALRDGDPAGLLALDEDLARDLWVGGLPAWRELAVQAPGPWVADLLYAGEPYGVHYAVATWLLAT